MHFHKIVEEELDTSYPKKINSDMARIMGLKRSEYGWTNMGCGREYQSNVAWYKNGYAFMYDIKDWNPLEDLNQLMMVVDFVVKKEKERYNSKNIKKIDFCIETDFEPDEEGNSYAAWVEYWIEDDGMKATTAIGKSINDTLVKLIYAITEEWE